MELLEFDKKVWVENRDVCEIKEGRKEESK